MNFTVEKINSDNYQLFCEMVCRRSGKPCTDNESQLTEAVKKVMADENFAVYAAKTDGKFVGWISMVNIPKISRFKGYGYIYVDELWTEEAYRRQGIATALLEKADEMKDQLGAVGVRLYVNTENPDATKLYRKCGFTGDNTAIFMEK